MMHFKNWKFSPFFNRSFNGWFALINHQHHQPTTVPLQKKKSRKNGLKMKVLKKHVPCQTPWGFHFQQKEAAAPGLPTPVHVVGRPGGFTCAVRGAADFCCTDILLRDYLVDCRGRMLLTVHAVLTSEQPKRTYPTSCSSLPKSLKWSVS